MIGTLHKICRASAHGGHLTHGGATIDSMSILGRVLGVDSNSSKTVIVVADGTGCLPVIATKKPGDHIPDVLQDVSVRYRICLPRTHDYIGVTCCARQLDGDRVFVAVAFEQVDDHNLITHHMLRSLHLLATVSLQSAAIDGACELEVCGSYQISAMLARMACVCDSGDVEYGDAIDGLSKYYSAEVIDACLANLMSTGKRWLCYEKIDIFHY